jgi:hypothetical protein
MAPQRGSHWSGTIKIEIGRGVKFGKLGAALRPRDRSGSVSVATG